ncbi:hypothetical protein [Natronosporangium hydrolyticum]|uniref:hypothetical protein n=1 Tax=Natronosporangium hydrolyticum TaxID=2811111 RepID=UPI001EFA29BE|nr:hypothetical protein [Natronosporangium hydrolyticum]
MIESPTPRTPWRAVALDGKTLRGTGVSGEQVHLLAVMDPNLYQQLKALPS